MAETATIKGQLRENSEKTGVSCSIDLFPLYQRQAFARIDDEIHDKFFGCGSPIPPAVDGCTILNLGCGTGRDVYLASQLVGPEGYVIGIDMSEEQFEEYLTSQLADPDSFAISIDKTVEQLVVARKNIDSHMARFGYSTTNVDFRQGYIEDLAACGIADNSVDLVISNCGLNLSPDKERVFAEVLRVLKPGGEFYFADVFSGRRISPELRDDPEFYGECLGGALYLEDFKRMLCRVGCLDYRVVSKTVLELENPESAVKAKDIDFYSMTIRIFKLANLEDTHENYGQTAEYLGTIPEMPERFILDDQHLFITGEHVPVCGNCADMLSKTRFAPHFRICGDRSVHLGTFGVPTTVTHSP
ncbi:MAG: methyltransferase domain-containing protein [Desulfuromonadaceae bacterium]|nr:methyltransferase domain-containing protein [Desulfuromonadaceae bacterium]